MKFPSIKLPAALTKTVSKTILKAKKYSPEALLVVGVGGVIYFTVKACQKTYEAHDIIDEHEAEMEDIKEEAEKGMPQDVHKERIRTLYVKTGKKLFKLYYKVVAGEVVAIACICCGFGLLKKRYLDVVAAYAGLTAKFKDYRKRVTEDVGEAVEEKYLNGLKVVEEQTENGEVEKKIIPDEKILNDDYIRMFAPGNLNYQHSDEANEIFLSAVQNYANEMLIARGHVFLNEIFDELGFPRTAAGACTGWVCDNPKGDGAIDFRARRVAGSDRYPTCNYILNFNVDGVILDLI